MAELVNVRSDRVAIDRLVAKLHRTRRSINAHLDSGQGLGTPERTNWRGCALLVRYDDLRAELMKVSKQAWRGYCDELQFDWTHRGFDLFA